MKILENIISWIAMGLLAGSIISFVFPKNRRYIFDTLGAGLIGAFLGGVLYSGLKIGKISAGIDPISLFLAAVGSLILMYFIALLIKNEDGTVEGNR